MESFAFMQSFFDLWVFLNTFFIKNTLPFSSKKHQNSQKKIAKKVAVFILEVAY